MICAHALMLWQKLNRYEFGLLSSHNASSEVGQDAAGLSYCTVAHQVTYYHCAVILRSSETGGRAVEAVDKIDHVPKQQT